MARLESWFLMGVVLAAAGCAEAGKIKGKAMNQNVGKMETDLEKLAKGYKEFYTAPSEETISEIDFKVLDMDWEGEYISAPDTVEASKPGIPVQILTRRSSLREWEVRFKKNSFLLATDLEHGETWLRPLEKPPTKRLKPTPEIKGRKPEPGEGHVAGVFWHLVGEGKTEPLLPGEYVVAMLNYDHISNLRRIEKLGNTKKITSNVALEQWPWDQWNDSQAYQATSASPKIEKELGCALKLVEEKSDRKLMGTLSAKARPINIFPPGPGRTASPNIQGGIKIDLIMMTLDKAPQMVSISVPIFGPVPIHLGDTLKGWFNLPFPFEPTIEDRMLYAVVDGTIAGPFKVPGTRGN